MKKSVKEPIQEAMRYLGNAQEILSTKAGKEDGAYTDAKYVKMAGDTAYKGILVALDSLLPVKAKGRKDVSFYKALLAKDNKKALTSFVIAYNTLHLSMGYDGNLDYTVAQIGLKRAKEVIDWAAGRMQD